jgi:hypothetical protein
MRVWTLAMSALMLGLAIYRPEWLRQFNRAWIHLGLALAKLITPIIMAVLFYSVFTPTAFLLRLLGKDLLRMTVDETAASYWTDRSPPGPLGNTMTNQF